MGKLAGFAVVTRKARNLGFQSTADVHKNIGSKDRLQLVERPLGGRRYFKSVNLADALTRGWPRRGQYGAMHQTMVNVKIASVVGIDHFRLQLLDQAFQEFYQIEQRHCVQ